MSPIEQLHRRACAQQEMANPFCVSLPSQPPGLYPEKLLLLGLKLLLAYDPLLAKLGEPLQLGYVLRLGSGGGSRARRRRLDWLLLAIKVLAHPPLALHPTSPPLHGGRGPVSLPHPPPVRGPFCHKSHSWWPPFYRSFSNPFFLTLFVLLTLRSGSHLLGRKLLVDLDQSRQLGGNFRNRLWCEEALPQRDPARLADRPLKVASPHVLNEQEASRAAGVKRSRQPLDIPLRETEGVALHPLLLR